MKKGAVLIKVGYIKAGLAHQNNNNFHQHILQSIIQ